MSYPTKSNLNPYLAQKVMSANPDQLISYLYDIAITACARQEHQKAGHAVRELISALNFDYKEQALRFFHVYRYISNLVYQGKFEEAKSYLTDLKKVWSVAMKVA